MQVLSGNSKIAQLKEMEQDHIIRKDHTGNGFWVLSRKKPKPKLDKRSLKKGKYSEYMDAIVLFQLNTDFGGESMQIIRLDMFSSLDYVYCCSAEGGCRSVFQNTLGDDLFDYVEREIISLIHRLFSSSIARLQRKGLIEVNQYYEFKSGFSTPEELLKIEQIKKDILFENEIKNEYILEFLMPNSVKEQIHKEIKDRVHKELDVKILRKVTDIEIISKKAKIPNTKQYKDCCVRLFSLMQEHLIKRARIKYLDSLDEMMKKYIAIYGEDDFQKLENFYIEHIRYVA